MGTISSRLRDQRGSFLLISLVLTAVMTLLGLALFDLGVLENRLVLASAADVRAFEIAQAGIDRAFLELRSDLTVDANWANGSPGCSPGPCATGIFRPLALAANTTSFDGGTYSVAVMQLTRQEATDLGFNCLPFGGAPSALCEDLLFVRSTGAVANGGGAPISRTIQLLAKADVKSPFLSGITVMGAPTRKKKLKGGIIIAGSIQVVGDEDGTPSFTMGKKSVMRNNYSGLSKDILNRLNPLELVCPKPGIPCTDKQKVESLGATLKVKFPQDSPAVKLEDDARIGEPKSSGAYGDPPRKGKGPLDGVYIGDGCEGNCKDGYSSKKKNPSKQIYADGGAGQPCTDCLPYFPELTDPATVGGINYPAYACPFGSTTCSGDFFTQSAARLDNKTVTYPSGCGSNCLSTVGQIFGSAEGLNEKTPYFRVSFSYKTTAGQTLNAEMCWDRPSGVKGENHILEFGSPTCDQWTEAKNPVLVYMDGPFRFAAAGKATGDTINYRGAALVLVRPRTEADLVKIEGDLQTACTKAPCERKFPDQDMMAIMTFGDMEIGKEKNANPVMALFYAGGSYYQQKNSRVIGSISASEFCFAGVCGDKGGGNPDFYQAPADMRKLPLAMFQGTFYSVAAQPGFWKECVGPLPAGRC